MTDVWRFYQRHADTWDRDRSHPRPLMERPYLDAVSSHLRPGARVLDLGCGTGHPIARYFIELGYEVAGVDAAPAMLALCRQRFPQGEWIEADMRALALSRRFGAIIAWDSFFHLDQDEQRAMFPVFQRHAESGAVLLFTSGPEEGAKVGTMYGEDVFHASLAPDEYRSLLASAGFRVLRFQPKDQKCGGHTSGSPNRTDRLMLVDFGKTASDYAKHRAGFPDRFFDRLFNGIVRQGDSVLDLGTGTGTIARGLAKRGCVVTGLDPSDAMLEQAKALDREAGIGTHYINAHAEDTRLPDASFDVVTAGTCWHWFDRPKAALEARRVLKPSGRILIANLDWLPHPGSVVEATEKLIKAHNSPWDGDDGTGIYPSWFADLSRAGFADIESFSIDVSLPYTHEGWLGRIRASTGVGASLPPDAVERFNNEHRELLARDFPNEPLQVPHRVFAVFAHSP